MSTTINNTNVNIKPNTTMFSSDGIPCTNLYNELKVGPMKRLYQYYTADAINLAGGVPMDSCFPTKSIDVTMGDGSVINTSIGNNLHLNYMRSEGLDQDTCGFAALSSCRIYTQYMYDCGFDRCIC